VHRNYCTGALWPCFVIIDRNCIPFRKTIQTFISWTFLWFIELLFEFVPMLTFASIWNLFLLLMMCHYVAVDLCLCYDWPMLNSSLCTNVCFLLQLFWKDVSSGICSTTGGSGMWFIFYCVLIWNKAWVGTWLSSQRCMLKVASSSPSSGSE
jgi:CDP-diglyceride synthetase